MDIPLPPDPPVLREPGLCVHCGFPVKLTGRRLARAGTREGQFCCYGCYFAHTILGSSDVENASAILLARFGVSAFFAVNVMLITWSLYGDAVPILFPVDEESRRWMSYLALVLSVPVLILVGIPYWKNALHEIRRLAPGVDSLIAVGTGASLVYSTYSTLTGSRLVYHDIACMVLVLVTAGRYLEAIAREMTQKGLSTLAAAHPLVARVKVGTSAVIMEAQALSPGDLVIVQAGEAIAADGLIVEGSAGVDESMLTGEIHPVGKTQGTVSLPGARVAMGPLPLRCDRLPGVTSSHTWNC